MKKFSFLKKNMKIILMTGLFGILYTFIVNPIATYFRIWTISSDKIIGIMVLGFPVEDILFFALVGITISSATLSFVHSLKYGRLKRIFK